MILTIGKEIGDGGNRYKVTDLLHADKGGYREEYRAEVYEGKRKTPSEMVRLIVYREPPEETPVSVPMVAVTEAVLRQRLCSPAFDAYRAEFNTVADEGGSMMVIVTEMNDAMTLRAAIANDDLAQPAAWRVFTDVVVGLNEISHLTNGGCHFGINPDNIYVYRDQQQQLRGLIRGLNLVCEDFEENKHLDRNLAAPEFRAPETVIGRFTPRSMQWSLAILLAYMLQGEHPWGLKPEASSYSAYSRMRRNKPQLTLGDGLAAVLKKALAANPANRYAVIDDFVSEVMKFSVTEIPASCECFGKPYTDGDDIVSSLRLEMVKGEEDKAEEIADSLMSTVEAVAKPKVRVDIGVVEGEGFAAVAGMNKLKDELRRDFIDLIANRKLAEQYGIQPPGMLFYGPPGCGKTYLAEHLAQELGIDYSLVNPADLGSIYIHGSQKMIAELFTKAEKKARKNGKGVLLIFDEMESMLPSRMSESNDNQAGEVAEFLTRLNNSSKRGVYVIGLTNCLDKIDKAALRKGRLDKVVYIDLPDCEARKALFEYELSKRPHVKGIDVDRLSKMTEGYTSSDITYIVTESARAMFASTLRENCMEALEITQSVMEDVIGKTRPSVTPVDLRHYEDMRSRYASGDKKRWPSVGFTVGS